MTGPATRWFRAHEARSGRDGGCWWFTSFSPGQQPQGRFDLLEPRGTCYLASTPEAAVRERVGRFLARADWIPAEEVDGRRVTTVATLHIRGRRVADATKPGAADHFRATRELFTINDYILTTQWAAAFDRHGFAAVVHQPRFSTGNERAVALFGDEGGRTWAVHSFESMHKIATRMNIRVAEVPHSVTVDELSEPDA